MCSADKNLVQKGLKEVLKMPETLALYSQLEDIPSCSGSSEEKRDRASAAPLAFRCV